MNWYSKALQNLGLGLIDLSAGTLKAQFVSGYTPSAGDAGHGTLTEVTGAGGGTIEASATITNHVWANRALDGDDVVVPDDGDGSATCLLVTWEAAGGGGTVYLLGYSTTAPGLPYTLDGTDDDLTWNASGILKLGA